MLVGKPNVAATCMRERPWSKTRSCSCKGDPVVTRAVCAAAQARVLHERVHSRAPDESRRPASSRCSGITRPRLCCARLKAELLAVQTCRSRRGKASSPRDARARTCAHHGFDMDATRPRPQRPSVLGPCAAHGKHVSTTSAQGWVKDRPCSAAVYLWAKLDRGRASAVPAPSSSFLAHLRRPLSLAAARR